MTDFAPAEYRDRTARAQALMARAGMDALFITTEAEFRYFTGFRTPFWQSPTRAWFLVIPARGDPVAVIPTIGEAGMRAALTSAEPPVSVSPTSVRLAPDSTQNKRVSPPPLSVTPVVLRIWTRMPVEM